jgi:hypothetical protein
VAEPELDGPLLLRARVGADGLDSLECARVASEYAAALEAPMRLLPGLTFSWRRALGISALSARISRTIGIPLTSAGRERKLGRWLIQAVLGLFR